MHSWIQPPPGTIDIERLWDYFVADLWGYILAAITGNESDRLKYLGYLRWDFGMLWLYVQDWVALCVDALDDWVEDVVDWLTTNVDYALEWVSQTWRSLGYEIEAGWYTAVSWAIAKRDEVWYWTTSTYGEAKIWARDAWTWVADKGGIVWDWIQTKGTTVWEWVTFQGYILFDWYQDKGSRLWYFYIEYYEYVKKLIDDGYEKLFEWIDTYQDYYIYLYDVYHDQLLDMLRDPLAFAIETILLSTIERWLYDRWFQQVK